MGDDSRKILFYVAGLFMAVAVGFKNQPFICLLCMFITTLFGSIYAYPYFLEWERKIQVFWVTTVVVLWSPIVYMGFADLLNWEVGWTPFVLVLLSIAMIFVMLGYRFYVQVKLYLDIKNTEDSDESYEDQED